MVLLLLLPFYYLFIIIFTALRYLAAAERPQHCALVLTNSSLHFQETSIFLPKQLAKQLLSEKSFPEFFNSALLVLFKGEIYKVLACSRLMLTKTYFYL